MFAKIKDSCGKLTFAIVPFDSSNIDIVEVSVLLNAVQRQIPMKTNRTYGVLPVSMDTTLWEVRKTHTRVLVIPGRNSQR
jgi:hypothetical protein